MPLAISGLDVAFVGALAALATALVSPLVAWLIARETHKHELNSARVGEREVEMSRARKLVITLLAGMALAVSFAPVGSADPNCSPGQNANPQHGFKPGGCK